MMGSVHGESDTDRVIEKGPKEVLAGDAHALHFVHGNGDERETDRIEVAQAFATWGWSVLSWRPNSSHAADAKPAKQKIIPAQGLLGIAPRAMLE